MLRTLLLTATITPPPNALNLVRIDPEARLQDYLSALDFYLKLPAAAVGRIIFVDNSNSDISRLCRLAEQYPEKTVEFLGFDGLDYPPEYGRGYGEFKLLDHAIEHSALLSRMRPDELVWKGTGRLRLLNLTEMIARAPAAYDLYCDLRNRPTPWMDLRFFSFTPGGYRRLLRGVYLELREDVNRFVSEISMHKIIGKQLNKTNVVPRFRVQPLIEGIQGFNNANYACGYKNRAKYLTRRLARRIVPGLWI